MKPYRRPISRTWWLEKRSYLLFMLREMTSIFIAAFLVVTLVQLSQLARGPGAYAAFLERMTSPGWVLFHLLALVAALYHTITWFNLTPKILVVRMGEERLTPIYVAAPNYVVWVVISAVIAWILLGS
ncbi:MAG: fumarate reductase subunit C [Candidatus Methylomirabilales bacterium]